MGNEPKFTVTLELLTNYLIKFSSEYHKVSISEICSYFIQRADYIECEAEDVNECADLWNDLDYDVDKELLETQMVSVTSNSTIPSQIRRLIDKYLMKTLPCGVSIWASVDYDKAKKIENTRQVFYAKRLLDETSINLLRDAIEVFPYAEVGKTASIIRNLNMLTPHYNRREFDPKRMNAIKYPGTYYENLEAIYKAFRTVKDDEKMKRITPEEKKLSQIDYNKTQQKPINKISFRYCEYNENKELKIKLLSDGEEIRIVNPVKLIWTNGYCYLVAAVPSHKKSGEFIFINYRVDRMTDVKCLDTLSEYVPDSNDSAPEKHPESSPLVYAKKNPVMYSENKENQKPVVIICSKKLINNALDTFGFDIDIAKTKDPEKVEITIRKSSYIGIKMWALEYGHGAEIVSPPELREKMKKAAEHLMEIYKD